MCPRHFDSPCIFGSSSNPKAATYQPLSALLTVLMNLSQAELVPLKLKFLCKHQWTGSMLSGTAGRDTRTWSAWEPRLRTRRSRGWFQQEGWSGSAFTGTAGSGLMDRTACSDTGSRVTCRAQAPDQTVFMLMLEHGGHSPVTPNHLSSATVSFRLTR